MWVNPWRFSKHCLDVHAQGAAADIADAGTLHAFWTPGLVYERP